MHKKTVKKKGKVFGPYYYTTVRARDGSVKTHYLGSHEEKAKEREREIHLSYGKKKPGPGLSLKLPRPSIPSRRLILPVLIIIALIASAFLITMPSEPGLYTIITNRDVPFDGQREVVFHDYKFSNNGNIILLSRNVHHCTWYPDSSPKKDLKHCRLIVEVEDWNDEAISMDDYTLSFRGLEEYSPRYLYSDQYTTYYEILDDSVRNETTRRIIREHYLKIQRRSWSGYRPLDSITLDTSKPFSILAEFEMPKYQEEHFDVEVALQGRTLSLDPTVSVCGDIDSSGVYTMNQSLESAADCIAIKSDDVIFDMAGFNITGLGPMYAINVSSSGATNITIRNGMTVIPDYGILVEAGGGLITNMTFNTGNGIKATGGGPFTVQYCTFDTDRGIHIESTLGTIRDNNFTNPGDYGVIDYTFGTGDNHIINNTFNGATNAAIDLTGTGNNVTNNSFTANVNDIRLNENSQIIADNTHFNCTGTACILLIGSDYSTITGEFINISDYGVHVDGDSSFNNISVESYQAAIADIYILGLDNRINGSFHSSVGVEIAGSVTTTYLYDNTTCTGTCFNITANNVTLDGAGHLINYSTDGGNSEYGVYVNGYNQTTIKNAIIEQGLATGSSDHAILFGNSSNGTIQNNTITTSGTGGAGIYFYLGSNSNNITSNTITTSGSSAHGIASVASSDSSITSNTITTSGIATIGIRLHSSSDSSITSNTIDASEGSGQGISLMSNSDLLIVTNNTIESSGMGLILSSVSNSSITNNTITSPERGVYVYLSSDNIISGGTVNSSTAYSIYVDSGSDSNNITDINFLDSSSPNAYIAGNNNRINGSFNSNVGIKIAGASTTTYLSGDSSCTGTCFNITANNVVLDFNNYNITGDGSGEDYGVYVNGYNYTTIKNGGIYGFGQSDGAGINVMNNTGITITGMTISSNTVGIQGSGNLDGYEISNVTVSDNIHPGIHFSSATVSNSNFTNLTIINNGDYGFYMDSGSNNSLTTITANNNDQGGVTITANNSVFTNISASNNQNQGGLFVDGTGNTLITTNSQFNNNTYPGIDWYGDCIGCRLVNVEANNNSVPGIFFASGDVNNSVFSNVTASNNGDYGISIGAGSGNNFTDIIANGNVYSGIYLSSGSNNILTNVTVNNNGDYGIYLSGSSDNTFRDSNLSSNTLNDTYLTSTSINNTFLNVTYTNEYVASGSELIRKWYYRAYVNDTDGNDVASANVTAYNTSGDLVEYSTTNSSGWVNIHLTEYTNVGGTTSWYSNYTIYANKTLYTNASKVRNISVDQNILNDYLTISGVPTVQSVALNTSGDTNLTTQNPECWATPSDPEESTLTAYVNWWNGSQHMPGLFTSKASVANATPTLVSTLGSGNTTNTDTWMCSVIFDDGTGNSTSWSNASLLVLINLDNLAVNVETNASVYEQGEAALITVTLSNSDTEQITGNLSITIEDYDDNQVSVNYYNGTAVYASTTTTKQDVNSTTGWAGVYNITAVFSVPGGYSKQTSLTFTIFAEMPHSLQVKLRINNTQGTVYVPGTGELTVSSMSNATYASPTHYYLASYTSSIVKSLVFAQGTAIALVVNRSTTTEHIMEVNQYLNNSVYYLVFTEGDWNLVDKRMELIEQGRFMTEIAPSFAYGLGTQYPIKVLLEYSTLDLVNNHILQKGYHKIVFESNSSDTEGASVIIRTP